MFYAATVGDEIGETKAERNFRKDMKKPNPQTAIKNKPEKVSINSTQ